MMIHNERKHLQKQANCMRYQVWLSNSSKFCDTVISIISLTTQMATDAFILTRLGGLPWYTLCVFCLPLNRNPNQRTSWGGRRRGRRWVRGWRLQSSWSCTNGTPLSSCCLTFPSIPFLAPLTVSYHRFRHYCFQRQQQHCSALGSLATFPSSSSVTY